MNRRTRCAGIHRAFTCKILPAGVAFWTHLTNSRIYVQHDLCDLAPVGTFRIRIEHAHVGDGMVIVVRGEFGNEGREIATSGLRGGMEFSCLGKAEALPPRVSRSWTPFSSELLIRLLFCS